MVSGVLRILRKLRKLNIFNNLISDDHPDSSLTLDKRVVHESSVSGNDILYEIAITYRDIKIWVSAANRTKHRLGQMIKPRLHLVVASSLLIAREPR